MTQSISERLSVLFAAICRGAQRLVRPRSLRPTSGSARRCWHRLRSSGGSRLPSGSAAERLLATSPGRSTCNWPGGLATWARQLPAAGSRPPAPAHRCCDVGFALPQSWTAYPLGLISFILAVSISFVVRFLVNLIAFWTLDVRGFIGLYVAVVGPLCGLYVPVHLFPEWLRVIAYGQRQRLAFSPQQTTAARVLAEVTAMTEVIDLTLEEPAIEDIVRTLYGAP